MPRVFKAVSFVVPYYTLRSERQIPVEPPVDGDEPDWSPLDVEPAELDRPQLMNDR